ncbi:MAG: DUF1592 domain-containing protein [Verrucomicrobiae bacterium]|nr:DUF1592 domain-containing protein [Verrucomicrobiae bacterium]
MKAFRVGFFFVVFAFIGRLPAAESEGGMEHLLGKSCLECHDDLSEKGDLSLESVSNQVDPANAEIWAKCLEMIDRGFMPPAEEAQPSHEERMAAILDLESRLVAYQETQPAKPSVLRRLNRAEYRNTIRDLFQLNLGSFDPTREFPADQRSHGFASDGETLVTSSFLLRQQLEAAEAIVARAIHFEPKPETLTWDLAPPFDRTTKYQTTGEANYFKKQAKIAQPYQTISERMRGIPKGGYHPVDELRDGVPVSGWYRIRIQAEAKFRHSLDQSKFTRFPSLWDESEPIRLSLHTGTLEGIDPESKEALDRAATYEQSDERHLATWDLPDDEVTWLECRVWLDEGHFPRLGFPNGPSDSNYRLLTYFKDNAEELLDAETLVKFREEKGDWNVFHWFESPRIRVHRIQVEGPINETWPPESHRTVFGEVSYESKQAEKVLGDFAARAWRRPVGEGELAPIIALVKSAEASGLTPELAVQEGLKAVLCSPEFLYREEGAESLDDFEIASRLSYFLWASMPDGALLERARKGELADASVRREEALRLLSDERATAFAEEFLDGWLQMRKLGSMSPDPHRFSAYYSDDLEPAMRTETRLFFLHLLNTNGSVADFLDSDYTFANRELAALYGIDAETVSAARKDKIEGLEPRWLSQAGEGTAPSTDFVRIALKDETRGGLLGQASILTLTANGVDTSPVIRGVWLLENILGTPPPPPPARVPKIEPDIRGAKTIRDQLEKHRESTTCRSCHAHIDPPGFALENFDPIGKWRGHYILEKNALEIDSTGEFGGKPSEDIVGFKNALKAKEDRFARTLVEKLLIHALGRELEVTDRPGIRRILAEAKDAGYPLRDLVVACAESERFARK